MRQKTIREAVLVATLGTFLFTSAPATARSASSAPQTVRPAGWSLTLLEGWISAWAGAVLDRASRAAGMGSESKLAAPAPPAVTSENTNTNSDRSAAIDPLGFR